MTLTFHLSCSLWTLYCLMLSHLPCSLWTLYCLMVSHKIQIDYGRIFAAHLQAEVLLRLQVSNGNAGCPQRLSDCKHAATAAIGVQRRIYISIVAAVAWRRGGAASIPPPPPPCHLWRALALFLLLLLLSLLYPWRPGS